MTDWQLRLGALVDELKRRGVLRVAAAYLIGAWVVIQVSDVVFPRLGFPSWTVTFVIVFLAVLFPVVVGVAWVFDFTRRGFERTAPRPPDPALAAAPAHETRHHRRFSIALAALMTIPLVGFGVWYVNDARGYSLDANLVAVTPFRVAGAAPEAHYLREGLMDLIAARIAGAGGGMQVVAPRTMSRTLRDQLGSLDADPDRLEALRLARELGAGRLLQGEVVSNGGHVTVTATLYDAFTGDRIGDPATIAAHPDSLHRLVDELAARLVAAGAGVSGDQLAHLTTSSLPALRLFLDGEAAFRRGQHVEAMRAYDHAVTLDSTFALAALGLLRARGWSPGVPSENSWDRAVDILRVSRERLSEADRNYFDAFLAGDGTGTYREIIDIRMRAAERAPDVVELQYLAGDALFHWGANVGIPDARERAREMLERTVRMDTAYMEPLIHLHDLAVGARDTAAVRRWGEMLLAVDTSGAIAVRVRFARSIGLAGPDHSGDTVDLSTLPSLTVSRLVGLGVGFAPVEAVVQELVGRMDGHLMPDERAGLARALEYVGMRTGRPSLRALAGPHTDGFDEWGDSDRLTMAIYWLRDADSVRAALPAVQERARVSEGVPRVVRECLVGHAAIALGDIAGARAVVARLDPLLPGTESELGPDGRVCSHFLHAAVAVYGRSRDALQRVTLFDDSLAAGMPFDQYGNQLYQLAAVRLWDELDSPERALAAARRVMYLPWASNWHTEMWGEEARLLDELGRREEAIAGYQRYLAQLEHAEPPFAGRAERARARLAALTAER